MKDEKNRTTDMRGQPFLGAGEDGAGADAVATAGGKEENEDV